MNIMTSRLNPKIIVSSCLALVTFIFMYKLNAYMPLWNDEFAYSFISGTQERVSSLIDIVKSEYNLYFGWTGRVIVHSIVQFFLLIGKGYFNVANAFMFTILLFVISQYSRLRNYKSWEDVLIFLLLMAASWLFLPVIGETTLWVAGSVNYLWATVVVISFLLPYHYFLQNKNVLNDRLRSTTFMFFAGIIAGWSQENASVIAVFIIVAIMFFVIITKRKLPKWSYSGLIGLLIGFLFLILAPGNNSRKMAMYFDMSFKDQVINALYSIKNILRYDLKYFMILLIVFIILHFVFYGRKGLSFKNQHGQRLHLSLFFICAGFIGIFAMVASPELPLRSTFASCVCFMIAISILIPKNKIWIIGILLACSIPFINSTYHVMQQYKQLNIESLERIEIIQESKKQGIDDVKLPQLTPVPDKYVFIFDISLNPNYTSNHHFAQYYNLKSVVIDKPMMKIELVEPASNLFQLYYDVGNGINESDSTQAYLGNKIDGTVLYFGLPEKEILKFRFDPGYKANQLIQLKSLSIDKGHDQKTYSAFDLYEKFKPLHDIKSISMQGDVLQIVSSGYDPQIEFIDNSAEVAQVDLNVQVPNENMFQVFYDTGKGYSEEESTKVSVDAQSNLLNFRLSYKPIRKMRIDVGYKGDELVKIKKISYKSPNNRTSFELVSGDLLKRLIPIHDIDSVKLVDDGLLIKVSGNDPQLELTIN